jgi:hypothetical protein
MVARHPPEAGADVSDQMQQPVRTPIEELVQRNLRQSAAQIRITHARSRVSLAAVNLIRAELNRRQIQRTRDQLEKVLQ